MREWDGEAAGDQFGWIARVIGDVDRDGFNDFVTSALTKNIHGENAGRVYVYSGRDGRVLLTPHGEAKGDNFGQPVASAGDVDGDGHADVMSGAPHAVAAGKDAGRAYVYSGNDGRLLLSLSGERPGDLFGSTVAGYSDGKYPLPRGGRTRRRAAQVRPRVCL